jgi:hypothetical protein
MRERASRLSRVVSLFDHRLSLSNNNRLRLIRERYMSIRTTALALCVAVSATLGFTLSASPAFAANSQQSKMTDCNKQAGDKKGDDRKAFMKSCLSASPAAASAPMTQQEKMTACNSQASGKKGDDRKAFMKSCLSNKG